MLDRKLQRLLLERMAAVYPEMVERVRGHGRGYGGGYGL